jgi:hypothetical protein
MHALEKNVITALAELAACSDSRSNITAQEEIMLLSVGLRTHQIEDLKKTLNTLRDKYELILNWNLDENLLHIELSNGFPIPEVSSIEKENIFNLRLRRILLFRLYEEYIKIKHRFVHVPLVTMAEPLGVSSDDIFRHVEFLDSQQFLDYGVMDGGQCTSDLTESGIKLCEDHSEIFDQFSAVKMQIKGEDEPVQYEGKYISVNRIEELLKINTQNFDLQKLIQLCKEANTAYRNGCLLSLVMIQRTIINHVPPIFGFKSFQEVVNNYNGGRSFKQLMERLDNSLRKVADSHLHQMIRQKEILPELPQVDFRTEIDILLSEIISILKT